MYGTEKQINWANEIISDERWSLEKSLSDVQRYHDDMIADGADTQAQDVILEARKAVAQVVSDFLDKADNASEIINNRNRFMLRILAVSKANHAGTLPQVIRDAAQYTGQNFKGIVIEF